MRWKNHFSAKMKRTTITDDSTFEVIYTAARNDTNAKLIIR